jgi:hypothetical protein
MTRDRRKENAPKRRRYARDPAYRAKEIARCVRKNATPEGKARCRKSNRRWYLRNRVKAFGWHLNRKYGITLDVWRSVARAQGWRCAICRRRRPLHTDHCHATGKFRGLLCKTCNTGLGKLGDTRIALARAAAYLRKAKAA